VKVFIADDSAPMREQIAATLSELKGIEIVGQAQNAPEAIDSIQKLKPDVVILDIRMPGGNGIAVLKEIKKYSKAPIVIMLTNYPYPQYRKKCKELGADYFFDKSTEFEKINEVLENLIKDSQNE